MLQFKNYKCVNKLKTTSFKLKYLSKFKKIKSNIWFLDQFHKELSNSPAHEHLNNNPSDSVPFTLT